QINAAHDHKTCNYPDHSSPKCSPYNPCDFDCKDGFSHVGNNCVCKAPLKVCNGKCVNQKSCPSQGHGHGHYKRDGEWWENAKCRDGYTACGVYGGNRKAWECIDTKYDLESCGGCAMPLHSHSPRGVDCTAIPGVADVACDSGECDVRSCKSGWAISPSGTSCVKSH
ncbi:hypothetical protein BD410DRAFT_687907, partial [Rickenella mellea]